MPNILFASNNIAHWPGVLAGSVVGTFDSSRVPYALAMSNYEQINSPVHVTSTGDETWYHFRFYWSGLDYNRADMLIQAYQPDSSNLAFVVTKDGGISTGRTQIYLYDGNTSITKVASLNLTQSKVNSVDVRYNANPLGLELDLFINGTLAANVSLASNPNSYVAPDRFSMGCAFTDNLTDKQYVSEIIVADADTRNARLDLLRPVAAGAYEQWGGLLSALADDDTTTGMTAISPSQRQTVTLEPYNGATNISNIVSVSQTTRGLNSPTKMRHTIRMGGVDYDSADIDLPYALEYSITDWKINPATSLPWDSSDLSGVETGFMSVA